MLVIHACKNVCMRFVVSLFVGFRCPLERAKAPTFCCIFETHDDKVDLSWPITSLTLHKATS